MGTVAASVEQLFSQGDLRQTDRPLDVAIQGQGFFEVERPDGTSAYTRLGSFRVNDLGEIVTGEGYRLAGSFRVPVDATEINIAPDGVILVDVPGESTGIDIGEIQLVNFVNPGALDPIGGGLYRATESVGLPAVAPPGEAGLGLLRQGFLEAANVDFVEELVELVAAQRAYQLNARVLQVSDEILAEINGLRR